jgi:hypothetical protein
LDENSPLVENSDQFYWPCVSSFVAFPQVY